MSPGAEFFGFDKALKAKNPKQAIKFAFKVETTVSSHLMELEYLEYVLPVLCL